MNVISAPGRGRSGLLGVGVGACAGRLRHANHQPNPGGHRGCGTDRDHRRGHPARRHRYARWLYLPWRPRSRTHNRTHRAADPGPAHAATLRPYRQPPHHRRPADTPLRAGIGRDGQRPAVPGRRAYHGASSWASAARTAPAPTMPCARPPGPRFEVATAKDVTVNGQPGRIVLLGEQMLDAQGTPIASVPDYGRVRWYLVGPDCAGAGALACHPVTSTTSGRRRSASPKSTPGRTSRS